MSIYTGALEKAAAGAAVGSAGLFAALSRLRRKRFFHPEGVTCEGSLVFHPTSFDLPFSGETTTLLRLSRGAGLPGSLPDVFGLAVKVPDEEHDFLLASSGSGPISRHMLLPARGFSRLPYSSVLPYQLGRTLIVFGARPQGELKGSDAASTEDFGLLVDTGDVRFDLTVVSVGEQDPEKFASLTVKREHHGDVRFNPWNCRQPLRPAGPLNRLRLETYKASQAARPDTAD